MEIKPFKNQGDCLQRDWFGGKINPHWGNILHYTLWYIYCPVASTQCQTIFRRWKVSWHTGQRLAGSAQSSDRPATVRGCWWINKRSRKSGLRIRSHSISEGSAQPISLLQGTISTTTQQALYNCCFLCYKQAVFITPFYCSVLSLEKK